MICRKVAVSVLGNGHRNSEYVVVSFRMMGYVIHNSQVIGASISIWERSCLTSGGPWAKEKKSTTALATSSDYKVYYKICGLSV